jgi:hypothetical protein
MNKKLLGEWQGLGCQTTTSPPHFWASSEEMHTHTYLKPRGQRDAYVETEGCGASGRESGPQREEKHAVQAFHILC